MQLHQLEPGLFAGSEPALSDLPGLARKGIKALVDSRIDDQAMDAVPMSTLRDEARKLGLQYVHAPVPPGDEGHELRALQEALKKLPRPTLLFSHSDVRSATVYVRAQRLRNPEPVAH